MTPIKKTKNKKRVKAKSKNKANKKKTTRTKKKKQIVPISGQFMLQPRSKGIDVANS